MNPIQMLFMLFGRIFAPKVTIEETTFAARACLVKRQTINIRDIAKREMWEAAHKAVDEYASRKDMQPTGDPLALYFSMDMKTGMTDFGIGHAVLKVTEVNAPGLEIARIKESKALTATVHGPYSRLGPAHAALWRHCQKNNYKQTMPVVEEYLIDPSHTTNPKEWETQIYCLYSEAENEGIS